MLYKEFDRILLAHPGFTEKVVCLWFGRIGSDKRNQLFLSSNKLSFEKQFTKASFVSHVLTVDVVHERVSHFTRISGFLF